MKLPDVVTLGSRCSKHVTERGRIAHLSRKTSSWPLWRISIPSKTFRKLHYLLLLDSNEGLTVIFFWKCSQGKGLCFELAISNSQLTASLMVPVLWDSSCKLETHYGPLKYFQKNVKNQKISEAWGYKKTVDIGHVINWYGEYLEKSFFPHGWWLLNVSVTWALNSPFFTTHSFLPFPWLDVSSAYFLVLYLCKSGLAFVELVSKLQDLKRWTVCNC